MAVKKTRKVAKSAPVRKARTKKRAAGGGRPAGVTAEQSAARQEKIERLFAKHENYGVVAEKMGMSYAAVYLRINRA
jgi:hypothetical protein